MIAFLEFLSKLGSWIIDLCRQRSSKRNTESKQAPLVDNKQSPVTHNVAGGDIIHINNNYYYILGSNSQSPETINEPPKDSEGKVSTRDSADIKGTKS